MESWSGTDEEPGDNRRSRKARGGGCFQKEGKFRCIIRYRQASGRMKRRPLILQ